MTNFTNTVPTLRTRYKWTPIMLTRTVEVPEIVDVFNFGIDLDLWCFIDAIIIKTHPHLSSNIYSIQLKHKNWIIFLLIQKYFTNFNLWTITDLCFYDKINTLISSFHMLKSSWRFILNTLNRCLPTTTTLFSGSVWLEREVLEFTAIQFIGLIDSRRLLTDYTHILQNNVVDLVNTGLYNSLKSQWLL